MLLPYRRASQVVMSKAYAVGANFDSADFTNAVLDRVAFNGADPAPTRPCVGGVYYA